MAKRIDGFTRISIVRALEYAELARDAMQLGSHPDTGEECLRMTATIQQYSAFLAALAVQHRTAGGTAQMTGRVQLQTDGNDDTVFWFPGMHIRDVWVPGARPGE